MKDFIKRVLVVCGLLLLSILVIVYLDKTMSKNRFVAEAVYYQLEPISNSQLELVAQEYEEPIMPYDIYAWAVHDDEYILAHVINGEAGANWCSDEMLYGVGSVVLNRVKSKYFPDTIEEVVFQKGQYACTWDGNYDKEPCERAWRIAKELLVNGSKYPESVVFQAQFKQGDGVYKQVQNMYFCYKE